MPISPFIQTPRLNLVLLSDTSEGSQHVQWFHEDWTDVDATAWFELLSKTYFITNLDRSLHGPTKSLEESREWMIEHRTKWDNLFYAVFAKPDGREGTASDPGVHVGSASLRRQPAGPTLPPFEPAKATDRGKPLNMRAIGYALYKAHWGKGYATEANKAMLNAYMDSIQVEKAKGEELFYLEAGVDEGNPGSQSVLKKIGFKEVGWKTETEPVFLGGEWRHGGYWILGQYM